ncbi:MAG TPA: hypothetical protein PK661_01530 [Syntrophorhabdaceae bacterium]|nr:hypothetical protein [Syntrophorhabdaceae bacterium]MDI9562388.1 hypothetical protein [Pseudomonadota bacterium]HOS58753.1 hypothetical protein [Syntrophorhabdaceae bacterium]HQG50055.1 hypothetical protein [Syntrophorhabdaceae bacterium]HQP52245.1 hypothetical protein [Syntrophorhabdaceae bacterium]
MAEIIHNAMVVFCNCFIDRRLLTHDRMVKAKRSVKQNIVEGSAASCTSKKTEIRSIGVAQASMEKLHVDFQFILRRKALPLWRKDHAKAKEVRAPAWKENGPYSTFKAYLRQAL